VAEFTAILLESIGPANRALIADPVFGMKTVTIPVIMQRMASEHGTPSTSDLFKLKAELKAQSPACARARAPEDAPGVVGGALGGGPLVDCFEPEREIFAWVDVESG
jgi:hypothetical protein